MNNLINEAKKRGIELEVVQNKNLFREINVFNTEVKNYELSNITNYEIKVIYKGKSFVIKTEDINDLETIFNDINSVVNLFDNCDSDVLASKSIVESDRNTCDIDAVKIKNDLIELTKINDDVITSTEIIVNYNFLEEHIMNTNSIELKESNSNIMIYVSLVANKDGVVLSSDDYYYTKNYSLEELKEFISKIKQDVISKFNYKKIESGKYKVLFDHNCMNDILATFVSSFSANVINKGLSVLNDKFNKKIFSDKISIIEDPKNNNYPGKKLFDKEGTETSYKVIIDKGMFITKLYNNKEAIKDRTSSTGNADGVHNMYLASGDKSFENLMDVMDTGILLTELSGLHCGINQLTGDMSLECKGYLVKDGVKKDYLNEIVLSTNLFEMLNNVLFIGNDLVFKSTSVGSPSVLCDNIMIVGGKNE